MKKTFLSLFAVASISFVACNNDAKTGSTTDSTNTSVTNTTVSTSSGDYSALADEFDKNSEAGKYMDARTGKPIKISVDRTTGVRMNAETHEPVVRYIYVDNNDWWAYDAEGTRLGRARYENDKVMYEGDNNTWVDYDVKWKDDSTKMKTDDMKIKTDKNGETKIKTDDQKIKVDKDGTVKEKKD